jgi:xanthine dehydrogenase accessory factor
MSELGELVIAVKGAGEMASALAWRLYMANFKKIVMLEADHPLAVRREVSFCEAVYEKAKTVEDVTAALAKSAEDVTACWRNAHIAVVVDPAWKIFKALRPDIVVDAILAKRNLGTHTGEASLVIGLGPGFSAGDDVHLVVETNRGHNLGRIITSGPAEPNTGVPGTIAGVTGQRVLRAPANGRFFTERVIGDQVKAAETIGSVEGEPVRTQIDGVIRGLIRPTTRVSRGLKIGDVDPRGQIRNCYTISDKARAVGGSVLEAILRVFNRPDAIQPVQKGTGK